MPVVLTEEQISTLQRMRQILHDIQKYTSEEAWTASELLLHVVMRKLQLISQMVYRLPIELKDAYPEVRWQQWLIFYSSGGYTFLTGDMADIEQLVQTDIPMLVCAIDDLLTSSSEINLYR